MASSTKTYRNVRAVRQKTGATFFRKAGEASFFDTEKAPPFFNRPVRPKLSVSSPDDPQEKEADAVADKVIQRLSEPSTSQQTSAQPSAKNPVSAVQKNLAPGEEKKKLRKEAERENETREEEVQLKSPLADISEPPGDSMYRKCAGCEQAQKVQAQTSSHSSQDISTNIESGLTSSRNSGMSLPDNTRQQMESSFGEDFSDVRIHNDSSAVEMSRDLNAHAFTHGNNIYFNSGKYDTHSSTGKHLLAHELTHVVQQRETHAQSAGQVKNSENSYSKTGEHHVQRQWYNPFKGYEFDPSIEGIKTAGNLAADKVKEGAEIVKDKAVAGVEWIYDKINDGFEWLKGKFNNIVAFASSSFNDIKNKFGEVLSGITSPFAIVKNACANMDTDALTTAWNVLTAGANGAFKIMKTVTDNVLEFGKGIWDTASVYVTSLFDRVDPIIDSWLFKRLPNSLQDNIRSRYKDLRKLWESTRDYWNDLWQRLNSFIQKILKSIKDFTQRLVSYVIQKVIDTVKTIKEVADFVQRLVTDPEAVIRPMLDKIAGKITSEAPGKAREVAQEKMSEALSKGKAASPVTGIIQRAPEGNIIRSTASRNEVNDALLKTFAEQWAALDIRKMLWDSFVNMFWPPATIRAIGHEFSELWNTDWTNALNSLIEPHSIIDDIGWFFQDVWHNILNLLDFPLTLWKRLNNILMLLLGYVTILLLVVGFVGGAMVGGIPGAFAGAILGLGLAAALGEFLFLSFILAEGASALKAFIDLFTTPQTQQEKDRDYLQIAGSTMGIAIGFVIALLFALLGALVSKVVSFVKGRRSPGISSIPTKPVDPAKPLDLPKSADPAKSIDTPAPAEAGKPTDSPKTDKPVDPQRPEPDSTKKSDPDTKSTKDESPKEESPEKDPVKTLEGLKAALRAKIVEIREQLGRMNTQLDAASAVKPLEKNIGEVRSRITQADTRLKNLETDLNDATSPEEINMLDNELNEFKNDTIVPLQAATNAVNIPLATPHEQQFINEYTDALRRLREAHDKIDGGAAGKDLDAANAQQKKANEEMDAIESKAVDEHNKPGSDLSRLTDQIATLKERRSHIQEGGGDPAIGRSFPKAKAIEALKNLPNESLNGLSYEMIEKTLGPPDSIDGGPNPDGTITGAIRLEWHFEDGSMIHVDIPGPENASPFEINRGAHAGINAPRPSDVNPNSNQAYAIDEKGVTVPSDSAPAHMPIVADGALRYRLRGLKR